MNPNDITDAQWQTIEKLMNELGHGEAYDPVYGRSARERVVLTDDTVADFGTPDNEAEIGEFKGYSFVRGAKWLYVIDLGDVRLCDGAAITR